MTPRRTELAIEELVLEGVRPADAPVVGAALERELARLVRERGLPHGVAGASVPASIEARSGESPVALGTRLAGAIYGRLAP
jgi:hypothetical protein